MTMPWSSKPATVAVNGEAKSDEFVDDTEQNFRDANWKDEKRLALKTILVAVPLYAMVVTWYADMPFWVQACLTLGLAALLPVPHKLHRDLLKFAQGSAADIDVDALCPGHPYECLGQDKPIDSRIVARIRKAGLKSSAFVRLKTSMSALPPYGRVTPDDLDDFTDMDAGRFQKVDQKRLERAAQEASAKQTEKGADKTSAAGSSSSNKPASSQPQPAAPAETLPGDEAEVAVSEPQPQERIEPRGGGSPQIQRRDPSERAESAMRAINTVSSETGP